MDVLDRTSKGLGHDSRHNHPDIFVGILIETAPPKVDVHISHCVCCIYHTQVVADEAVYVSGTVVQYSSTHYK